VVRFGYEMTIRKLQALGCEPVLRTSDNQPFVTDNGNFIVDCRFGRIDNPLALHDRIHDITGVVDNGLFIGMASRVIVGYSDGTVKELEHI
jgi:ribose 5-phosphate isomerase A